MTKNKKLLIIVATLLLISGVLFILEKTKVINLYERTPETTNSTTNEPKIDLSPPTEEESKAGDEKKQQIINQEQYNKTYNSNGNSEDKTEAEVVIVDATQYDTEIEVRAFASNVLQNGTCTFVFTNGSNTITKSMPASADASTTPCMTLTVPRAEFNQAGSWNLSVNFESSTYKGQATTKVGIQ